MMTYAQWLTHNEGQLRRTLFEYKLYSTEDFNHFAAQEYSDYIHSLGK